MLRSLLVFLLGFLPLSAFAGATPDQLLQRFVDSAKTLQADFEQRQLDDQGNEIAVRGGTLTLARPGRFDWRYTTPYEQRIVCDGETIWNYEPDLAQVTASTAEGVLEQTPAALLARPEGLDSQFALEAGGLEDGYDLLRLRPRSADADFSLVELWLDAQGAPHRLRLHDPLGGISDLRFAKVQRNPHVDLKQFEFTPPDGVDVVRLEAPAE